MAASLNQNVFLLSFGLMIMIVAATDVCDMCNCFPFEENTFVIACKSYKNHILEIDFEAIEWPQNENRDHIKAFFNHFPVNLLPKFVSKILDKASVYDMFGALSIFVIFLQNFG
jgi:hypothetical protein